MRARRARLHRRRGLTLMEMMVAISILLVMSGVVFESLRNSLEFHHLLSARDETVRTARAAIARLQRDLQLAYLTPNRTAVNTYQTVFVGLDEEPTRLFFATLNHQRMYLDSRECDQSEVTVWAEPAPEERGHGFVLYHRESPRIDQYPDEQGVVWPLAYNVRSFRVRYLDQVSGEWRNEWDTRSVDTPYRLPRAIEIGLVLIAPDPEDTTRQATVDVPFLSSMLLEYAERMPNPNQPQTATLGQGGYGGGGVLGLSGGGIMGGAFAGMGGGRSGGSGRNPAADTPGKATPPPGLFEGGPVGVPKPWER